MGHARLPGLVISNGQQGGGGEEQGMCAMLLLSSALPFLMAGLDDLKFSFPCKYGKAAVKSLKSPPQAEQPQLSQRFLLGEVLQNPLSNFWSSTWDTLVIFTESLNVLGWDGS